MLAVDEAESVEEERSVGLPSLAVVVGTDTSTVVALPEIVVCTSAALGVDDDDEEVEGAAVQLSASERQFSTRRYVQSLFSIGLASIAGATYAAARRDATRILIERGSLRVKT